MDEEYPNPDGPTQGPTAAHAGSLLGRARHSVRAAPGHQVTWVGNRGVQGTARPTDRCFKVKFNGQILEFGFAPNSEVCVREVGSARCADFGRVQRASEMVLERTVAQVPSAPKHRRVMPLSVF